MSATQDGSTQGVSPYSTGGGGVTFERKVAVTYLARLLLGGGAPELGDGRQVLSVAFQQAPDHPVDDLVVAAGRSDETVPSLVLAIGVRRAPDLVKSDESTQKLISDFVRAVVAMPSTGHEHRFALVVAGPQPQAEQLAQLADLAAAQVGAPELFRLVTTPKKFSAAVRERLVQLEGLVRLALTSDETTDPGTDVVQRRTWQLLSRLTVLMPRLETPDQTDWFALTNALIPVGREGDLEGASRLQDRLVALAAEYPAKGATVDITILRRDAHVALGTPTRRNRRGWQALSHLNDRALSAARDHISAVDGIRRVHIDRGDIAESVFAAAGPGQAVVVYGESGVGKSGLILSAAPADPSLREAVCINLRHLPTTTLEFESILGCPLSELLAELTAPPRTLVIDAADAVAEGRVEQLRYLVDAARHADVGVIAVAASDARQVVRDSVAERFGTHVVESEVPALTDAQLADVVVTFGELANLAENPRSRDLLRRLVVVDLLVRGGVSGVPLSDADAMQQIWIGLVRRHGQTLRGTPDARDIAMLRLADLALSGGNAVATIGAIDPDALDGLRRDGLLRPSVTDPFTIGPEFAHDEIRRYAIARLLHDGIDPTVKLCAAGVPRWALASARLACQLMLTASDSTANPLSGRFARLQASFDLLVDLGNGERWGDVPGEALLTLGEPDPVLREAWPQLCAGDAGGLKRLRRLIDQRLHDGEGLVRIAAVEPLVTLLLEDSTPWRSSEQAQAILRNWLRALAAVDTPPGHPLRSRLRDRLVAACAAAEIQLDQRRAFAAAARAARTPEQIETERDVGSRRRSLFSEIGQSQNRRRQRPEVPPELTDEVVVELLALLGPDLSVDGEAILRRIANDAPARLAPAVESLVAGRALALYGHGLLASLTEAYYIDDEQTGFGFHDDAIRRHDNKTFGTTPFSAPYRGPFAHLFQSDFRNGVATLNRMLNHAALARARTLARHGHNFGVPIDDADLDGYRTRLNIAGDERVYVGDDHVWRWYRGGSVGPPPCSSALQALEKVCDQFLEIGWPLDDMVSALLDGCENIAMVGLVVGLLVRHIERADHVLDPYLTEPDIWLHEFGRAASESTGMVANSDGVVAADRRTWTLREVAMYLVVRADSERAAELRGLGLQLVLNARRHIVDAGQDDLDDLDDTIVEEALDRVRVWSSSLDRDTYHAHQTDDGFYIQSTPPDPVLEALQRDSADLQRGQQATRLLVQYHIQPKKGTANEFTPAELAADLLMARDLLTNSPASAPADPWDIAAAVAASILSAHLLREVPFPDNVLVLAVDIVLRIGSGDAPPRQFEYDETYFEQGADRIAADAVALLLLPTATDLLALVDGGQPGLTHQRSIAAGEAFATAIPNEVRLHLARGLDRVWDMPCADTSPCHHEIALQLVLESMRDCAIGNWDPDTDTRSVTPLADPVETSLSELADDAIYFPRLDASIRALAPAAIANICVSARSRTLLGVALTAQRRALLSNEHDFDQRGTHTLVSARAMLTLAAANDEQPLLDHLDAFADRATLLGTYLRALSSAAEESATSAYAAQRIWPRVIVQVLELQASGHDSFSDRYFGDMTLAALLPNAAGEVAYLYRELDGQPIVWWEPTKWRREVELWLPVAVGTAMCVDHLIIFLGALGRPEQLEIGLPWVSALVLPNPERIARRSYTLSAWLIEARSTAIDIGVQADWQRIVDALVVAGDDRLAPYSE